jgi:hypothetical protein
MSENSLATVCGLYCGFYRLYMNNECAGCGVGVRAKWQLYKYCRNNKNLKFCSLCSDFPCESFLHSKCLGLLRRREMSLTRVPLQMRLSFLQRVRLWLFGCVYMGHRTRVGWKGSLPFYAFKCEKHSVVENYPQGFDGYLDCPVCDLARYESSSSRGG